MQQSVAAPADMTNLINGKSESKSNPTKGQKLVTILRRPKGASLAELIRTSGCKPTACAGFCPAL